MYTLYIFSYMLIQCFYYLFYLLATTFLTTYGICLVIFYPSFHLSFLPSFLHFLYFISKFTASSMCLPMHNICGQSPLNPSHPTKRLLTFSTITIT